MSKLFYKILKFKMTSKSIDSKHKGLKIFVEMEIINDGKMDETEIINLPLP